MLTFLTGLNGATKRKLISERISRMLEEGRRVYLVVPEQSSFERDRDFLYEYGEKKSNMLKVTSFSALAQQIIQDCNLELKPRSDENARAVLMSMAVKETNDALNIYKRFGGRSECVNRLLSAYDEMKQAGLTADELQKAGMLSDGVLKEKTRELHLIFSAFEALLNQRFSDPSDNLKRAEGALQNCNDYNDSIFFFDGFRGFTGAQLNFLTRIAAVCGECFISVTAPNLVNSESNEAFEHSLKNAFAIRKRLSGYSVTIDEYNTDTEEADDEFAFLRCSLFGGESIAFAAETDNVKIIDAGNMYIECELAAVEIKRLLEQGFRCRDIAVIERGSAYAPILIPVLQKYGIPVFEDKRKPFYDYPLIRLVLSAVEIAVKGFNTEKVLFCVKTELFGIDEDACAELETYVYSQGIDYSRWEREFTGNPDGFGSVFSDEAKERLARINETRRKIVEPLSMLREQIKKRDSENSCKAVYFFLKEINAAEYYLEYAAFIYENATEPEAVECARVWDECMAFLDSLKNALNGTSVSPEEFFSLLQLILCSGTLGEIPTGIDEILIGCASRIKLLSPKATVILGANEGVFPQIAQANGLFNVKEQRLLAENGFDYEGLPEYKYAEERLIAYEALTASTHKLIVCCSDVSATGEKTEKSELINEIKRIIPKVKTYTQNNYSSYDFLATPDSAFEKYAETAGENSEFSLSLKSALMKNENFAGKVLALDRAAAGVPARFEDESVAHELFGEDIASSASQLEAYHKCPFMYFCRYGLGINKSLTTALDNRINGLLVHKVLEDFFNSFTNSRIAAMDGTQIKENTALFVKRYVEEYMGGYDALSSDVKRELIRCEEIVCEILERFAYEFGKCSFVTEKTELKIGGSNCDIPAYKLDLPDGGSITIIGSIDRVDTFDSGTDKYVRVIDYKTGGKDFKLGDVFSGLNMQMLIYLFSLIENGKNRFGDLKPAGVLYVPAKNSNDSLGRNASNEDCLSVKLENGKMKGLLLENEKVFRAMDSSAKGVFIAASIGEKGEFKGNFISAEDFDALYNRIKTTLINTAMEIKAGHISISPCKQDNTAPCTYCDYAAVCLHESNGTFREIQEIKHSQAREMLNEEAKENG